MNEIINEKSKSATKTSSNNTPLTQNGYSLPSASKFTDLENTKHDRREQLLTSTAYDNVVPKKK